MLTNILQRDFPNSVDPHPGCRFHPRGLEARDICSQYEQKFDEYDDGYFASCHFINSKRI